jgi:hypothetical protein
MHQAQLRISAAAPSRSEPVLRLIEGGVGALSSRSDMLSAPARMAVIFYCGLGSWALLALVRVVI